MRSRGVGRVLIPVKELKTSMSQGMNGHEYPEGELYEHVTLLRRTEPDSVNSRPAGTEFFKPGAYHDGFTEQLLDEDGADLDVECETVAVFAAPKEMSKTNVLEYVVDQAKEVRVGE